MKPRTLFEKIWNAHTVRAEEGKPALLYDFRSPGARSYLAVADELLARHHAPAPTAEAR